MGRPERPLDPEAGPLERFAFELRQLRRAVGPLSYRELARRAHYSKTVLSEAAGGQELPTLAVTLAYVEACGGDRGEWEARWRALAAELAPEDRVTSDVEVQDEAGDCPYLGLAAFQPEDAEWFFGREQLVADLVTRLDQTPFLAVFGPSGSGKSSVLRAGLLPAVWGGGLPGASMWTTIVLTPGPHPLEELAMRVALGGGIAPEPLLEELQASPGRLRLAVRQVLADAPADAQLLLLVDQFEETFTLCRDDAERRAFVQALVCLSGDPDSSAKVVLGVRADFYARCADYPELVAALEDRQVLVGPMNAANLRRAIEGPAARAGLALEPGLLQTVLGDLGEEPGSLPLLSHALFATWQRRRSGTLTVAGYQNAGGVRQAITQTAEAVYGELSPAQQVIAKDVFLRLTAFGEGTEDTRRRTGRAELFDGRDTRSVEFVLDRLAQARLVTLDEDSVEVAHEALIRGWPRLRSWLNEDRDALRAHRRLTEAAAEWSQNGREEGFLYRGPRLAAWQDRPLENLTQLERAFLAASREREAYERTASRRRVRLAMVGLSTALAVISILAVLGLVQLNEARSALSRQLAARAEAQLLIDPELSILLARRAFDVRPTPEAEAVLRQAILESRVRATLRHQDPVLGVAFDPDGQRVASASTDGTVRVWDLTSTADPMILPGHQGWVLGVAFSPDGQQVASAGLDGTVRVWDLAAGANPMILSGHDGQVRGVAFGPDGQHLASAGLDGTVRVWDLAGTANPMILSGHQDPVLGVAFSPDGQRVASASQDGTVRVWQWTSAADPVVLRGHNGPVSGVAFSPDGQRVASASDDGTVRVWDLAGGADPIILRGHQNTVSDVAFSPDGQRVASASQDGTVRAWELAGGADPVILRGHQGWVFGVAFSPDGQRVASAGDDTVRIWDLASAANPMILSGHQYEVLDVTFSPDGQQVASASTDGTVRVWDLASAANPMILRGHQGWVFGVAFSPDGQRVASASTDDNVRVWDLASAANPVVLRGHQDTVLDVAFSPDGQHLASASKDDTVRVWDLASAANPVVLRGHQDTVSGVAFGPDGQQVASASTDGTVRVWQWTSAADPLELHDHDGAVRQVAFSSDGQHLASAGLDGTVRVWDLAGGADPIILRGHQSQVFDVAFSPEGQRVASASDDGTVRVWDLASTADPIILRDRRGGVFDVAFSPDGQHLASASKDDTVRVWTCEVCGPIEEVLALAETRVTRELTSEERATFLHEPTDS